VIAHAPWAEIVTHGMPRWWPWAGLSFGYLMGVVALVVVVGLGLFVFWVWMIVDCARREFDDPITKLVWMLVIVVTWWIIPFLGAIIYLIVGRPQGRLPGPA
jgi:hypothetical protein